ncbi:ROK family protein, partial [Agromyces albus]
MTETIIRSAARSLGAGDAVLAFDVGGTDTKSALVDASGTVLGLRRTPTPRDPADPAGAIVA